MHRKWFRQLFRRRILVIFLLVAQAAFLIHLLVRGWRISQGVKVRLIYDDIGCFFLFFHKTIPSSCGNLALNACSSIPSGLS